MSIKKQKKHKASNTFSEPESKTTDTNYKSKNSILKDSESVENLNKDDDPDQQNFFDELDQATKGLNYISETDAGFLPFIGGRTGAADSISLLTQINAPPDSPVEEREFEDFFKRLTTIENWFDKEQIQMTYDFVKLRNILEENLRDIRVFKVGRIQIDIYIVGLDKENNLVGVQTRAIET